MQNAQQVTARACSRSANRPERDEGALRLRRSLVTVNGSDVALEILAGGDEQRLHVHVGQPAEQEPAELVPLFRLAEAWLDPDLALAHRLLVRLRRLQLTVAFPHILRKRARDMPRPHAVGAALPQRARRAGTLGG